MHKQPKSTVWVAKAKIMDALSCADVAIWFHYELNLQDKPHKLAALRAHINCCPTCTQALKAQISSRLGGAIGELGNDCDTCQADLAAFIEIEHDQGIETARDIYPHVWWHLLGCEDCFALYQETAQLITIDRELQLPPMVFPIQPAPKQPPEKVVIPRRTLGLLFSVQPAFGVARGQANDAFVLARRKSNTREIVTRAYEHTAGAWTLLVEISPPHPGFARIMCGEARFGASFNANGRAEIVIAPATLITSDAGPDIEVVVEAT